MAVPDTNTFSLQDVANEFTKEGAVDLTACFASAVGSKFDPAYVGNKDRLSNFRNYAGVFAGQFNLLVGIGPGSSSSWSNQITTLSSAYIGHDVRFVWKYTSGSSFTGDFQLGGNVTLGTTIFDLDTYSGTPWQTSRVDTADFDNVSFFNIATGTTALRWNRRVNSAPPSSGTGLTPPPYFGGDNTYYYAETSSGGSPSKRFWLRSPQVSITSGNQAADWWRGNFGATMGNYRLYVEVIT